MNTQVLGPLPEYQMQSEIYHNIIQNRHPVSVWTKTPMHVPCPAKVLEYPGRAEYQEKKHLWDCL